MSVAVVRKLARHLGLPFRTAAEELRDNAEMTPMLLLVRLHWKSLLFPDIYYDRCRTHFTLMHDTGKGYNMGDPQKFLGALLHNAATSGNDPSPKAKLLLVYLDLPTTSPLINSCTRKYRDWTEEHPVPEGDERAAPEEHFVWLSKDYTPYENDPGSPFVPPDFTLGLPPIKDWPRRAGEAPWVLDTNGCPKPVRNVPVDFTSSMDDGKKKKKWKKKHRRSKKRESLELKVTTRGEGANIPVWACAGSKDSSSSSDSQSDSGVGSNPSFQPHGDTDTEPRWGTVITPLPSPDPTRELPDDNPLSDRGEGDGDQEMPDARNLQGVQDSAGSGPAPIEVHEGAQPGDDWEETVTVKSLRSLKSPYNRMRLSFKVFGPYHRLCQRLMGPLVLRYRFSSGKVWQKPPLKTGPSYGEPRGPYVTG